MGRAKDIKSYVKQGAEEAETEIELKGKRGKRNPVIWRKFNRESEASDFKINGEYIHMIRSELTWRRANGDEESCPRPCG